MKAKLILGILLIGLSTHAQVKVSRELVSNQPEGAVPDTLDYTFCVAAYDYVCHTTDAKGAPTDVTYPIDLLVGKQVACSMGKARHNGTSMEKFEESQLYIPVVFQGYPKRNELTQHDVVPFNRFETTAPADIRWTLHTETDRVCGMPCQRATATYGGREWTAWFCSEIPSSAGPWRLCGLPGLILRAEADGVHSFTCSRLDFVREPILYTPAEDAVKAKHQRFVKFRNQKMSNPELMSHPERLISPADVQHMEIINGTVMINGIALPKTDTKYVPLELK
ncbi:MAG: GLPGLI family protein [Bacteroidales bacterium]|nr:GLPGLI family protein [Bacteroidales bacterium]